MSPLKKFNRTELSISYRAHPPRPSIARANKAATFWIQDVMSHFCGVRNILVGVRERKIKAKGAAKVWSDDFSTLCDEYFMPYLCQVVLSN